MLRGMTATLLLPQFLHDGTLQAPRPGLGVLVDNGKIVAVGEARELSRHKAEQVTLQGTLMPGLIDVHTHVVLAATPDPAATFRAEGVGRTSARALKHLAQHLSHGVTTVRDLGGGPHGLDLELMRAQADGFVWGPRVVAAGALVAMTGGHACYLGVEADGVDEVRKAVRAQLKAGAAVIKVVATGGVISTGVEPGNPQMTEAEMAAAVDEAVNAGRRVSAHAQGTQGILNAVRAGVHSIEHGFWLDESCAALMKERGTTYVATFAAARSMLDHLAELPAFIRVKMEKLGSAHMDSFARVLKAGVPLAAGTDAGTPFNHHGNVAWEVALHVEAGASVLQAIHAATGGAAQLLGREDLGVIRAGAVADLLCVEGNPVDDIRALTRVTSVWQGGNLVDLGQVRALAAGLAR
jgi:imidazolonepropionase-like amidohydrolase